MLTDPVILIHDAWAGRWGWAAFAPLLQQAGYAVMTIDLPGNGAASSSQAEISLALCVDYIPGVVRGIGRPVSLIAYSGGGLIASQVANAAPGATAGLCCRLQAARWRQLRGTG